MSGVRKFLWTLVKYYDRLILHLQAQIEILEMSSLRYKTISANAQTRTQEWYVVDAAGQTVGRLSSKIASVLRGKNKPSYTPHVDCGDFVIVLNADKVVFTGQKWNQKEYITYSGYTGGQKRTVAKEVLAKHPDRVLNNAVKGMLPKTKLGRQMIKKLFIYQNEEHPHSAQQPKEFTF